MGKRAGAVPAYYKMVLEGNHLKKLESENRQLRKWEHQLSLILKSGSKMSSTLKTEDL